MAKKRDEFGTIKLTQEDLQGKMTPKPPAPKPPVPKPPEQGAPPPGATPTGTPALKPPPAGAAPPAKPGTTPTSIPALQPPARGQTPTAMPALKPGAASAKKVAEKKAVDVCKMAELSDDAKPLLTPELTVQAFVQALQEAKLFLDAVKVLAFALPKREVIGWALHCVKPVYGPNVPKPVGTVFLAVQMWLGDQGDNHRRAAYDAAEAAGTATPAGCVGMAVFFSGGSLAPANTPPVAPAPNLTHLMVANALQMAALVSEPAKASEKLAQNVADGLKLAGIVPDTNGAAKPAA
jgi:hypothetical protein